MIGRWLYGLVFLVGVPGVLVVWAWRLEGSVSLAAPDAPGAGAVVGVLGVGLMVSSWFALFRYAGGLPMNAYPPPEFTRRGIYRWLDHPIYIGFVLVVLGSSIFFESGAGFWLVTPVAAGACAALVLGYERDDLRRRFGEDRPRAIISLARDSAEPPTPGERWAVLLLLMLPWLVLYEVIGHLPVRGAVETWFELERAWPVIEWTEMLYVSVYPVVVLAPFVARSSHWLRRFVVLGMVGTGLGMLTYLTVPLIAPARSFEATTWLGELLMFERADGLAGRAAFPAFHVFWALGAAAVWRERGGVWTWLAPIWIAAAIVSCSTTGMHSIADIGAGVGLYWIARSAPGLWTLARRGAQVIANSWREWRIGPVRILNHGFYAGFGASAGVLITTWLVGPGSTWALVGVALGGLLGAALWGQLLVGGKTLLRPFGYFGCVLGASLTLIAMGVAGMEVWALCAGLASAAPWVQAIGRGRCLIQGCCHGAPCDADRGIVYRSAKSRVSYISRLGGRPLHPTPLYSIAANLVIGALLMRLWVIGAPASFIIGGYLILAGLARFVEESYRGEPQTQMVMGLRIYQVFAVLSVGTGVVVSSVPSSSVVSAYVFSSEQVLASALIGVLYMIAMGVDLPGSNFRFSRLAD